MCCCVCIALCCESEKKSDRIYALCTLQFPQYGHTYGHTRYTFTLLFPMRFIHIHIDIMNVVHTVARPTEGRNALVANQHRCDRTRHLHPKIQKSVCVYVCVHPPSFAWRTVCTHCDTTRRDAPEMSQSCCRGWCTHCNTLRPSAGVLNFSGRFSHMAVQIML